MVPLCIVLALLTGHELGKEPGVPGEFRKGALLHHAATGQHVNAVGRLDGAEAVRNHHARHLEPFETGRHHGLGTVIQSTGGFIKEHDRRFAHQGAGNQQALALPAGEIAAALTHKGVQTHGEGRNVLGQSGGAHRLPGVLVGNQRTAGNVLKDRAGHERTLLQHAPYLPAHRPHVQP